MSSNSITAKAPYDETKSCLAYHLSEKYSYLQETTSQEAPSICCQLAFLTQYQSQKTDTKAENQDF